MVKFTLIFPALLGGALLDKTFYVDAKVNTQSVIEMFTTKVQSYIYLLINR